MHDPTSQLASYEYFLESLVLYPELYRTKSVEMDLKGYLNPSHLLNELFFNQQRWLTFDEFFNHYNALFRKEVVALLPHNFKENFEEGLKARLYRTQFGFLTEYHAFFLAASLFGVENVNRSTDLDRLGVDFQINYAGQTFNIHIFVDTPRAWNFRNYKSKFKGVNNLNGIHVNLPYSLKNGRFNSLRFLKNRFGVYTENYLHHLKSEINLGKIKNNNIIATDENGFVYAD